MQGAAKYAVWSCAALMNVRYARDAPRSAMIVLNVGRRLLLALAVMLSVALPYAVGYSAGASRWKAQAQAAQEQNRTIREQMLRATQESRARANAVSADVKAQRKKTDEALEQAKAAADKLRGDLAAAVRAGRVQLRPEWSGCVPPAGAGPAATHAAKADAARRADSAGRIIAASATDAAVMTGLWDAWKAEHDAVIAAGYAVEAPPGD
ncbi:MAG TPA: hypothetical protein ACQGQG_10500 [Xylella sp.]